MSRPKIDFKLEFAKQMRFIDGSCDLYDNGNEEEASRIATALVLLFSRESHFHCIIPNLFDIHSLKMLSTHTKLLGDGAIKISDQLKIHVNSKHGKFLPNLSSDRGHYVAFHQWWDGEALFFVENERVTRRVLSLWARNLDGGAHVQVMKSAYAKLADGAGWTMSFFPTGSETPTHSFPFRFAHQAALREIAFEVLNTPVLRALWRPIWNPDFEVRCQSKTGEAVEWMTMERNGALYDEKGWKLQRHPQFQRDSEGKFQIVNTDNIPEFVDLKQSITIERKRWPQPITATITKVT